MKSWALRISFLVLFLLILLLFLYFILFKPGNENLYSEQVSSGKLKNPVANVEDSEALRNFDDTYVHYLLYLIKAYNLHNPPLSNEDPLLEVILDDSTYHSYIKKGIIQVFEGGATNEDIIVYSTKSEVIKMLRDSNYIIQSFDSGNSKIELKAGSGALFSKGYLNLYNELTGDGITGGVVAISSP